MSFIIEVSPFVPVYEKAALQQTIINTQPIAQTFETFEQAETALLEVCADKVLRVSKFRIVEAA